MLGPLTLVLALTSTCMGNTPSVTGPDRGRLHVIGDDDEDAYTVKGQTPEQLLRIQETVAQLADEDSEEEINRKSNGMSVPESHLGHNGAQCRGAAMSNTVMSDRIAMSDIASAKDAREMSRNAVDVVAVANNCNGRSDETMCREIMSSECE